MQLRRAGETSRLLTLRGNMSFYANYLRERTDDEILETERGFVSYRFLPDGKSVYIVDIYVLPEFRKGKEASAMADDICRLSKQRGCIELIGSVIPSNKGSTDSLKVLLSYGMTLKGSSNDIIFFSKEL